jgi:N-acetylmuramoyl-L-alanine amidase
MIRSALSHFLLILTAVLLSFTLFSQEKTVIRKIVIDAGHGGKDPGTIGRKTQEKEIALAIALKLGKQIQNSFEDVKVIYTRETDVFIELYQRAEIANKNKADLFISIHCNANPSHSFQGTETYVMGLHKSQQNLEISRLENASILMEPDYLVNYNGFDPNSAESYITFSLFQNAFLNQSMEFASLVQGELKGRAGMGDRGVRQAGFLVLYKTTMPSVLIETGFLSNPVEESFLLSNSGQAHIADAICRAFTRYKENIEKPVATNNEKIATVPEQKTDSQERLKKKNETEIKTATVKKMDGQTAKDKPIIAKQKPEQTVKDKPVQPGTEPKPIVVKQQPEQTVKNKPVDAENTVRFCVQIAAYPTDIGVNNKIFEGMMKVSMYKQGELFKYIVGNEKDVSAASRLMQEIHKKGFKDAFVVAFDGNERITIDQAKQILKKQTVK